MRVTLAVLIGAGEDCQICHSTGPEWRWVKGLGCGGRAFFRTAAHWSGTRSDFFRTAALLVCDPVAFPWTLLFLCNAVHHRTTVAAGAGSM